MNSGGTACEACPTGTYAKNTGQQQCIPCPVKLTSMSSSTTCGICAENFYFVDTAAMASAARNDADFLLTHADELSASTVCAPNTTLDLLPVPPGLWRASAFTSELLPCTSGDVCPGFPVALANAALAPARRALDDVDTSRTHIFCAFGSFGPRSAACSSLDQYFDGARCQD
jgi:hypothetical protein